MAKKKSNIDDDPMFATTREGANSLLSTYLERVERLTEEKKGIADDIKDIFSELKASGYNAKIARKMLALRKMDEDAREEEDTLTETYRAELGL